VHALKDRNGVLAARHKPQKSQFTLGGNTIFPPNAHGPLYFAEAI
jgi:hypothetical protein